MRGAFCLCFSFLEVRTLRTLWRAVVIFYERLCRVWMCVCFGGWIIYSVKTSFVPRRGASHDLLLTYAAARFNPPVLAETLGGLSSQFPTRTSPVDDDDEVTAVPDQAHWVAVEPALDLCVAIWATPMFFFFVRTPQTNPVSCKPVPLREQHSFHTSLIIHQSLQTAFLASSLYRGSTCSAPEALHYSGATEAIDGSVIFATFRAFSLHLMSFFDGCGWCCGMLRPASSEFEFPVSKVNELWLYSFFRSGCNCWNFVQAIWDAFIYIVFF